MTVDDAPVHGIPRPTVDDLVLRRRLRILREILADPDSIYRSRLIDLTDMVDNEDQYDDRPMPPAGERRLIDLPGGPPPRRDGRR